MRILLLHNRYQKAGGEDSAFQAERDLLLSRGHQVETAVASNDSKSVSLLWNSAWSASSFDAVEQLCRKFKPDVAHVHNFWMSWTPSVHAACHAAGVPTVQTLHNFRLFCANALCLRDGQPCQDCLGGSPWLGAARRCYRNSFVASAAVARMIDANRRRGTWQEVGAFITPSDHTRSMFLSAGLPPDRVFTKPNVVADLGLPAERPSQSRTLAFVGRLSREKGVAVLLEAWKRACRPSEAKLVMAGEEQNEGEFSRGAPADVTFAGRLDPAGVRELLGSSRALVAPSICYEVFGMSVVEAFSRGRPAIVSDLGALANVVEHGRTGLRCTAGDAEALARQIEFVLTADSACDQLGVNARAEYLRRYSVESNYGMLMDVYRFVRGLAPKVAATAEDTPV